MTSHWTLALLLMISVFLGISRASVNCESAGNYQCVDAERCTTLFNYRVHLRGCQRNQVCCKISDIRSESKGQSCGVNGQSVCIPDHMCRADVVFRHANECPNNLICCEVEDQNTLAANEPLR